MCSTRENLRSPFPSWEPSFDVEPFRSRHGFPLPDRVRDKFRGKKINGATISRSPPRKTAYTLSRIARDTTADDVDRVEEVAVELTIRIVNPDAFSAFVLEPDPTPRENFSVAGFVF
ncbi:TPA: hypothetical protein DCE37_16970 [Candidatus Latescibacteria bacterium]|nr:hypothetical protein [Candidatus Latescibacterota bacterium]